jgi:hypothetical protein
MINIINAQLPKKVIDVMVYVKMKLTPPLEMGSKTYQHVNGASGHSRKLGLKIISKTYKMAKSKEAS